MTAAFLHLRISTAMQQCHLMLGFVMFDLSSQRSQLAPLYKEGSAERNLPDLDSMQLSLQSSIAHTQLLAFLHYTVGSDNRLRMLDNA